LSEPKQPDPWEELGELLVASGNMPEGIAALAKAHDLAPTPELAMRIGTLYDQIGNGTQAQRYLQNALKQARAKRPAGSQPTAIEGDSLAQLADLALRDKQPLEAERHIKQLERDFPQHSNLADLKTRLGKDQAALEAAQNAEKERLKKEKEDADKHAAEAKAAAEKAKALAANAVIGTTFAGAAPTVLAPAHDPALESLERHQDPAHWKVLAAAKAKAGDYAWAEAAYLEAMRLQPGNAATILAYLDVVSHRRAPVEYLQECEKQLSKYPEIPELYLVTARGYRDRLQNKRNAGFIFNRFVQKFPNYPALDQVKVEMEALR
jgi:tetratricopeptide (TPR) repeat protein